METEENKGEEISRELELITTRVTSGDINFVLETMYREAPHDKGSINPLLPEMAAIMDPDAENNNKAPNNFSKSGKEKLLSLKYQLDWIRALNDQIDFSNNPEVLPEYVIYFRIRKRFE